MNPLNQAKKASKYDQEHFSTHPRRSDTDHRRVANVHLRRAQGLDEPVLIEPEFGDRNQSARLDVKITGLTLFDVTILTDKEVDALELTDKIERGIVDWFVPHTSRLIPGLTPKDYHASTNFS